MVEQCVHKPKGGRCKTLHSALPQERIKYPGQPDKRGWVVMVLGQRGSFETWGLEGEIFLQDLMEEGKSLGDRHLLYSKGRESGNLLTKSC